LTYKKNTCALLPTAVDPDGSKNDTHKTLIFRRVFYTLNLDTIEDSPLGHKSCESHHYW
jgi:hypothetical protein